MAWSSDNLVEVQADGERALPRPKRRGVWAAVMMSVGIVNGNTLVPIEGAWLSVPLILSAIVLAGFAMAIARRGAARAAMMPLLAAVMMLIGAGWEVARTRTVAVDRLDQLVGTAESPADDAPVTVEVTLTAPGVVRAASTGLLEPPRWQRPSRVGRAMVSRVLIGDQWREASGRVTLVWPAAMPTFQAGDRLRVVGEFTANFAPGNPGQIDPRPAANQDGRAGTIIIDGPDAMERLDRSGGFQWLADTSSVLIGRVRKVAMNGLDAAFPDDVDKPAVEPRTRAMMRAMLLGEQESELPRASQDLARLGLVHVLSISGFHLAVLALVVLWVLRAVVQSPRRQALIALAVTVAYAILVPAEAPVLRSAIMVGVLLVAEVSGRRYDRLNVLGWTACVLLLWRPHDLFTPGFQLSFLSTGVLLWKGEQLTSAMIAWRPFSLPGVKGRSASAARSLVGQGDSLTDGLARAVAGSIAIGVLAVVSTAPLVLWHTGMFPGWGVLLGIALTPLASLSLVVGFAAVIVGAVWGSAGVLIGAIGELPCRLIFAVADLTENAPGASQWLGTSASPFMLAWAIATTAAVLLVLARRGRWYAAIAAATLLFIPALVHASGFSRALIAVWTLALPGSTCSIFIPIDRRPVLVDPGSSSQRGEYAIRRAAWAVGGGRFPATVVITSARVERFNHLPELIAPLHVVRVHVPRDFVTLAEQRPLGPHAKMLDALARAGVERLEYDPSQPLKVAGETLTIPQRGPVQWRGQSLVPLSKRQAQAFSL